MTLFTILTWVFIFLVFYTYLGYPLLLVILSRLFKNPVKLGDELPSVSLIVAAYNEETVIKQKIENSFELDYPPEKLQIMIVSDGSSDQTPDIAKQYDSKGVLALFEPERRGKSAALNRGVEQATGDILVFSDANAFYYPDAIKKLVRNFNDPRVGCVSGRKTVRSSTSSIAESEGLYWKYESYLKKAESHLHSTTGVVGEMNAIRRQQFQPIPANMINDDAFLAFQVLRQGLRVIYEPEAVSWETSAQSTRDEVIRRQRINAGRYQLFLSPRNIWPWNNLFVLFMMFSHKFARLLLPFFMIGALVFNLLAVLLGSQSILLQLALLAQVVIYLLAFLNLFLEQVGIKVKLIALIGFIVSSNLASLNGLIRYLNGKQTVLWEKGQRGEIVNP